MAEACYKPNYLPASYKGVPFEALEVNSQHGRRGAQGEFPFGEETGYADMGRKIRTYSISGRFATNDHIALADALIAAVETPGPGILVHPTRGAFMAACQQLRVKDDPDAQIGVTTFDMDLVEANVLSGGLGLLVSNLLGLDLTPLVDAVSEFFLANYLTDNVPFYDTPTVLASSTTAINSIYTGYQQAAANSTDIKVYRGLASFKNLSEDVSQLLDKNVMLTAMTNGDALIDKYANSTIKTQLFRDIVNANSASWVVGTEGAIPINAVQTTMRTLGGGYMARSILETTPKDMNEAFTQYDTVSKVFDQELEILRDQCQSKMYVKLSRFYEDLRAQLLDRAYNSPALVQYQFPGTVHSIVAAYEIFGDASRFPEIEQRNPNGFPWQVGPSVIAARSA